MSLKLLKYRAGTKTTQIWLPYVAPALISYVVFMAWPLLNSLWLSLYTGSTGQGRSFAGLDNFINLFTEPRYSERYWGALGHTVIFFLIHLVVQNGLGILFATLLTGKNLAGWEFYQTVIFVPVTLAMLPGRDCRTASGGHSQSGHGGGHCSNYFFDSVPGGHTNPAGHTGEKLMKHGSLRRQSLHLPSHIILGLWTLIVIFPLWVMIINSFKDRLSIYQNPFGFPKKWNVANYSTVLMEGDFLVYFKNSLIAVVLSLAILLFVGALASYALANWRGKTSRALYFFCIAGMMLPIKIASIRLLELIKALGLLNTIWALIPIYVSMGIPVAVFILTEFIRAVPYELTEAAIIDGASRFTIFLRIITPLLRPALATVAIYNFVPFWNDLWFPLIFISDDRAKTVLLGVTRLFGQYQTDWSRVLAVLTLSTIPVIGLYLAASKQFIKGLTAGAVKG
jgi:raffinose/stachyose/melibiose transport system permease protein